MEEPITRFLQKLEDTTGKRAAGNGTGWKARCPAHDDINPSLSVSEKPDGTVLVHCHAGCASEAVVRAVGLEMGDLFVPSARLEQAKPKRPWRQRGDIEAVYSYRDADGTVLHEKVRCAGKVFSWRSPDGHGGYVHGRSGAARLYRQEVITPGVVVWLAEGEKDADALAARVQPLGAVAVSVPDGAGKWNAAFTTALCAASAVIIVRDKDDAGREHARHVYGELLARVPTVSVVESPVGKDASDLFEARLGIEDMVDVTAEHRDVRPAEVEGERRFATLEDFAAVDEPGAAALLGEDGDAALIAESSDVIVYGDGGAGKTTLTTDLAFHLAGGVPWLELPVARPLRVALIENEGPRALFRRKLRVKLAGWSGSSVEGRIVVLESPWAAFSFTEPEHRAWLAEQAAAAHLDVIIVGPVAASGMEDAGTIQEARAFMRLVNAVREQSGRPLAVLLVHHEAKGGRISGAWEGSPDTLLHVQGRGHGHTDVRVEKARWASRYHGTTLKLLWTENESYALAVTNELTDHEVEVRLLELVEAQPGASWSRVEAGVSVGKARSAKARDDLLARGFLVNVTNEGILSELLPRKASRLYLPDHPDVVALQTGPGPVQGQGSDMTPQAGVDTGNQLAPGPELKEGPEAGPVQFLSTPPRNEEDALPLEPPPGQPLMNQIGSK